MADSSQEQLVLHLTDMHALEMQSIKQLERASELAGDDQLKQLYKEHLEETQEHERLVRERIEAHDHEPSPIKDLTMRSGAIGLRQLADIPPDTPVKLAMHFYALENLEVAAYELLARIARESGDDETAEVADKILEQERGAADKIADTFDRSVELMLEAANSRDEDEDDDEDAGESEQTDDAQSESEAAHATRS
jgi:ferritin-like metal-binding protein YciE